MDYSYPALHRIAHLVACQELSDTARRQVSTYGDDHRRSGELVEDALGLVSQADEVLRLAVAAERSASTSWQEIGERLEVTRQAAHERFARIVDEISDGVLFPARESENEGELGWWACPDGLEDPEAAVRRLDEWALRHREPSDVDRGEHPVSEGLAHADLAATEAMGMVTALATRIMEGNLPRGVSEPEARRLLLERKIETFDLLSRRQSSDTARDDARAQAAEAFEQLVAWHREALDQRRLTVETLDSSAIEGYRFALDTRAIAELHFTAEGSTDDTGWFLWAIDTTSFESSPDDEWRWLGEPSPVDVDGVDVDALVSQGREQGHAALRPQATRVAQRTRSAALHAARAQLLGGLAGDLARGVDVFDPFPKEARS